MRAIKLTVVFFLLIASKSFAQANKPTLPMYYEAAGKDKYFVKVYYEENGEIWARV